MKNEFLLQCLVAAVMLVAIAAGILVLGFLFRRERYHPSSYEIISDRVRSNAAPAKVVKMIPSAEMKIITNKDAIFWGWAIVAETNGSISTQWFRAVGFLDAEKELEHIYDFRLIKARPPIFSDGSAVTNGVTESH